MLKKRLGIIINNERDRSVKELALVVLLAVCGMVVGCGNGEADKASARASVPKQVIKWKHLPKSAVGSQKGIVVELEGDKVTAATLYDLKAGDGFAIYSTIGKGVFVPEKGHIVFSNTGNLQLAAHETAQINDTFRWEVPFQPSATNLAAEFWLEGRSMGTIDFARFQE